MVKNLRGHGVSQAGEALLYVVASLAFKRIVVGALVHMTGPTASIQHKEFVQCIKARHWHLLLRRSGSLSS